MLIRCFVTMALALLVGARSVSAQCPGATNTPFGADDSGVLPCSNTAAGCENKVEQAVFVLAKAILKCHKKQADAVFKVQSFDEQSCESAAKALVKHHASDEETCEQGPLSGKSAAERFNSCVAKASASGACAACNATNQATILSAIDSMMDGSNNSLVYCTP